MPRPAPAVARLPRLLLTPGEPAGIGPDLVVELAGEDWPVTLVAVADPGLLRQRAVQLGRELDILEIDTLDAVGAAHHRGRLPVLPVALRAAARAGTLDPANARYVLETLAVAADACRAGRADALVTAPVHKGVINDAGIAFTGHTEFLAEHCGAPLPVMMLAAGSLRVALATTHLPLRAVADALTAPLLESVLRVLHHDLRARFGIASPRIVVCGLNPHAGEGGHLGHEERDVIEPVLARLRSEGFDLHGPRPADTVFVPAQLQGFDAVLAMYHDQGLPVLKHAGFGDAVNVTLGLPILRTSVDHGTALDLAGSGRADAGSLRAALRMAIERVAHAASEPGR